MRGKRWPASRRTSELRSIPACAGEARVRSPSPRPAGVHPRVCGGSRPPPSAQLSSSGPSPRVRGKLGLPARSEGGPRSIPACAGEASASTSRPGSPRVHPRVCGGSSSASPARHRGRGPSPRVRGKRPARPDSAGCGGSIPACAGEATSWRSCRAKPSVHPRVCGGSGVGRRGAGGLRGPSPRVRGKHEDLQKEMPCPGSIPACAGEASLRAATGKAMEVHPRVCGGSQASTRDNLAVNGPSPRVRGKLRLVPRGGAGHGSIPACAGEARDMHVKIDKVRVHPRVCGGSWAYASNRTSSIGPSPRVRGKPPPMSRGRRPTRSIPACAGEAGAALRGVPLPQVHPRVCGGSLRSRLGLRTLRGPSPRVRGKLDPDDPDYSGERSIPACAGEALKEERKSAVHNATFYFSPRRTRYSPSYSTSFFGGSPSTRTP